MLELNHPRKQVLLCDANGDGCYKENNLVFLQWLLSTSQS